MVMWERPAGPAAGDGVCAGRVMYDGRHEPECHTQPNDPSPITNVPLAEKACDQRFADAYNGLNGIVFSATTMLLVGDSSFG